MRRRMSGAEVASPRPAAAGAPGAQRRAGVVVEGERVAREPVARGGSRAATAAAKAPESRASHRRSVCSRTRALRPPRPPRQAARDGAGARTRAPRPARAAAAARRRRARSRAPAGRRAARPSARRARPLRGVPPAAAAAAGRAAAAAARPAPLPRAEDRRVPRLEARRGRTVRERAALRRGQRGLAHARRPVARVEDARARGVVVERALARAEPPPSRRRAMPRAQRGGARPAPQTRCRAVGGRRQKASLTTNAHRRRRVALRQAQDGLSVQRAAIRAPGGGPARVVQALQQARARVGAQALSQSGQSTSTAGAVLLSKRGVDPKRRSFHSIHMPTAPPNATRTLLETDRGGVEIYDLARPCARRRRGLRPSGACGRRAGGAGRASAVAAGGAGGRSGVAAEAGLRPPPLRRAGGRRGLRRSRTHRGAHGRPRARYAAVLAQGAPASGGRCAAGRARRRVRSHSAGAVQRAVALGEAHGAPVVGPRGSRALGTQAPAGQLRGQPPTGVATRAGPRRARGPRRRRAGESASSAPQVTASSWARARRRAGPARGRVLPEAESRCRRRRAAARPLARRSKARSRRRSGDGAAGNRAVEDASVAVAQGGTGDGGGRGDLGDLGDLGDGGGGESAVGGRTGEGTRAGGGVMERDLRALISEGLGGGGNASMGGRCKGQMSGRRAVRPRQSLREDPMGSRASCQRCGANGKKRGSTAENITEGPSNALFE